ncbi:hypothetical protein PB1_11249 [Bacillus methanolicus PB1]|uniref:Uncharacterized protein n=1 Tax=Bacillus methanolicus PB1 TaxID=997296 RepID=I3DV61_BACMT|nr:hypothetical protein [Bacillus methanolicus]EIJ78132.1 hypothetical protein PB1_11249 [Bacillus methanolicus PB1]
MPRGKELEQLPMSNTPPGMGDSQSKMNRTSLEGITSTDSPSPSQISRKKMKEEGR